MRVTITASNVFSEFGIRLPIGSIQTVNNEYGKSLVASKLADDTDSIIGANNNALFSGDKVFATQASAGALGVSGNPIPDGSWLTDPVTREVYGQSDGTGGVNIPGMGMTNTQSADVRLGVFGDSLTANAFYSDPTLFPNTFNTAGITNMLRAWGWPTWIGPISNQRIQVVRNYSVQTTGVLIDGTVNANAWRLRYQVDYALQSLEWPSINRVVIMIGTNDVNVPLPDGSNVTIAACVAELKTQIARIGKPVILVCPPPYSGTVTNVKGDGLALWAWLQQLRIEYKKLADASNGKIAFVDAYSLVNTPAVSPDVMQTAYSYDPVHLNNVGALRVADQIAAVINPTLSFPSPDIWPNNSYAGNTDAANLDQAFANPLFITASGGTAGTGVTLGAGAIAGSLTLTGYNTGTIAGGNATVVANTIPGGSGNMQSMIMTSAADGDGITITTATAHAAGGNFLKPGDSAFAQFLLRINTGGILPKNLFARLVGFTSPITLTSHMFDFDVTKELALSFSSARTFLLRTPSIYMPSGMGPMTLLQITFRPIFAAAGNCAIDISNMEIRRIKKA